MSLSRNHFVEAARYIRERLAGSEHAAAVDLIVHLGSTFNRRFDEAHFQRSCERRSGPGRAVRDAEISMTGVIAKIEAVQALRRDPAVDPTSKRVAVVRMRELVAKVLGHD
jgi:hypothetical protein